MMLGERRGEVRSPSLASIGLTMIMITDNREVEKSYLYVYACVYMWINGYKVKTSFFFTLD